MKKKRGLGWGKRETNLNKRNFKMLSVGQVLYPVTRSSDAELSLTTPGVYSVERRTHICAQRNNVFVASVLTAVCEESSKAHQARAWRYYQFRCRSHCKRCKKKFARRRRRRWGDSRCCGEFLTVSILYSGRASRPLNVAPPLPTRSI